jgi:hypothetical protein
MKAQSKQPIKATPKTKLTGNIKKGESQASPRLSTNHNETLLTA